MPKTTATYLYARTVGVSDAGQFSCPGAGEFPWNIGAQSSTGPAFLYIVSCSVRKVPRVSRCPWSFSGLEGVGELRKSIGGFDAGLLVAW